MADFTITIANRLTLLGGDLADLWGVMVWGVDKWGTNDQVVQDVGKLVADTLILSDVFAELATEKILSNSLSFDTDITAEYLTNGIWATVFPGNVTNANDRIGTTYVSGGAGSGSYSNVTPPATAWS